ncbi:YceD family protein [Marinisporobacter balticus]|uniref:DUF177 domain-containing protein n=1 Tax=Marinisporobacter balticus TaxID=2018667 RepID=A0A4R2L8H6_9FIRM|nr:DUF177 domain-containing protein [Marinisporobacter balticus]TCO78998.1 uncharacterized protein EV214_10348 [Marinisporobacter balticus]
MKVSLAEIVEGQLKEVDLEIEDKIRVLSYFGDEIPLVTPVVFKGKAYDANGDIYIKGIVESMAEYSCCRCLKKFQQKIIGEVHEKLIKEHSPKAEVDEYFLIKNNMIDISEIMENTLILSLPMKIICDENCKGLCLVCGKNLNEQACDCEKDEIDPRLAKLKDLLQ